MELIAALDLDRVFLGNTLLRWIYALGIGLGTFAVLLFVRRFVTRRATRLAAGAEMPAGVRLVSTLVAKTQVFPLFALSLLIGSKYLLVGARGHQVTTAIIVIMIALQVGVWASTAVRFFLAEQAAHAEDRNLKTVSTIVMFVANLVIWALVALLVLQNVGIEVGALLAGLGIGGIAVALAVQNVLGDLLSSVSIALDKPFAPGDFLILENGFLGSVESVGIKSTRLRSLSGEQIVMPNSELVRARIRNMGRMRERRVVFGFGVLYSTPLERLREIPGIVRAAIESHDQTRFDRAHFQKFGDSSLDFEVVYHVLAPDYAIYMDIQQAVNLKLIEEFAKREIGFAFPTRTLWIEQAGGQDEKSLEALRREPADATG
jgi:small-conductance mechanosensitive channel